MKKESLREALVGLAAHWRKFADTDYTTGQKLSDARKQGQYELMMAGQSLAYATAAKDLEALLAAQPSPPQPAGERELRDAIARGLVISLTPAEHDEELITAIANEVRPLLAAPTSTGESHDTPQGGQHDS